MTKLRENFGTPFHSFIHFFCFPFCLLIPQLWDLKQTEKAEKNTSKIRRTQSKKMQIQKRNIIIVSTCQANMIRFTVIVQGLRSYVNR